MTQFDRLVSIIGKFNTDKTRRIADQLSEVLDEAQTSDMSIDENTWNAARKIQTHLYELAATIDEAHTVGKITPACIILQELELAANLLRELQNHPEPEVDLYVNTVRNTISSYKLDESIPSNMDKLDEAIPSNMDCDAVIQALSYARCRLLVVTESYAVWFKVVRAINPRQTSFTIPSRFVKQSTLVPEDEISISDIDDILIAQDSLKWIEE